MADAKDIMAATGKYTRDGEEKTIWTKCGSLLIKDDGRMSIKLDVVPIGGDGWLQVFDRKPRQDAKDDSGIPF